MLHTGVLSAVLALAGTIGIALRVNFMSEAQREIGDPHWSVLYDFRFTPDGPEASCAALLPAPVPAIEVQRETFTLGETEALIERNGSARRLVVKPREADGSVRVRAQFDLRIRTRDERSDADVPGGAPIVVTAEERQRALDLGSLDESERTVAVGLVEKLRAGGGGETGLLDRILAHCAREAQTTPRRRALRMVSLCRVAGVPARVVTGFTLSGRGDAQPHFWVEAYEAGRWRPFDPTFSVARKLPAFYLPVVRDTTRLVEYTSTRQRRTRYVVESKLPSTDPGDENGILSIIDLTRLPPGLEETVVLILLLPLGGLITSAARRFLGLRSFGYFTAALLAVSFVNVPWRTAIVVFLVITVIGLAGRLVIGRMKLVKLPRLSMLLILVVVSLTITVSLLDYLDLTPSSRAVLLPMVCLTMMFERFHVDTDRKGLNVALKRLAGTLVIALACYVLFSVDRVQWLFLSYPEVEFFVASALVLVGRVTPDEGGPVATGEGALPAPEPGSTEGEGDDKDEDA